VANKNFIMKLLHNSEIAAIFLEIKTIILKTNDLINWKNYLVTAAQYLQLIFHLTKYKSQL